MDGRRGHQPTVAATLHTRTHTSCSLLSSSPQLVRYLATVSRATKMLCASVGEESPQGGASMNFTTLSGQLWRDPPRPCSSQVKCHGARGSYESALESKETNCCLAVRRRRRRRRRRRNRRSPAASGREKSYGNASVGATESIYIHF